LEFSRTRTHYLVFKEQVFLVTIVTIPAPLSRDLFFRSRFQLPRPATDFVTQSGCPVNPSVRFFYRPAGPTPPPFRYL